MILCYFHLSNTLFYSSSLVIQTTKITAIAGDTIIAKKSVNINNEDSLLVNACKITKTVSHVLRSEGQFGRSNCSDS